MCVCVCVCVLTSCTSSCIKLRYRRGRPRCSPVHCINCRDDHMKMIDRDARLRINANPKVVKSHFYYDQFYIWRIGSPYGWGAGTYIARLPFSHCKEACCVALQMHCALWSICCQPGVNCFVLGCTGSTCITVLHWAAGMLNDALWYFTMHWAAAECTGMQWRKSASSTFSAKAQHPPASGKQSVEKRNLTDDSFQVCIARLLYRQMGFKHRLRALLSGWRGMVIIIRSSWLNCAFARWWSCVLAQYRTLWGECLTTLKDRATQLLIKYKNGVLVTQLWNEPQW